MSPMRTSNWTRVRYMKSDVNGRRVNKEQKRRRLAEACFVNVPRLVLRTENGINFKLPKSVSA